ncbi:energy transducer TonB [Hymenobacter daeguensis]
MADLAAARAAAPDGRVCGTFRREQVVALPAPALSRRLRWFVVALVLVVGQGLTAHEALAQVRKPVPHKTTATHKKQVPTVKKKSVKLPSTIYEGQEMLGGDIAPLEVAEPVQPNSNSVYTYAEQMPELPGGGGQAAIVRYIQQRVRYPQALKNGMEGRVYASFVVDKNGQVRDARIVKGLDPLLDAETLRVIQALPTFTPGRQGGEAVPVSFTVPVTYRIE